MTEYFTTLFAASNTEWNEVIQCVQGRVTEAQNVVLLEPVLDKEVK